MTELIAAPLLMPTTIVGQTGAQVTQSTKTAVTGCSKLKKSKVKARMHNKTTHTKGSK